MGLYTEEHINERGIPVTVHELKVLLVEDSSVLAERMAETITQLPEIDLIKAVASEEAALFEISKRRLDVVPLDLQLKQGTGFGILRRANFTVCQTSSRNWSLPEIRPDCLR